MLRKKVCCCSFSHLPLDVTKEPDSRVKPVTAGEFIKLWYLWVEDQLLLVKVQQRHRVGLRVVDEDLQAGIQRRALTVGTAGEHALEHLLWTQHRHHLQDQHRTTTFIYVFHLKDALEKHASSFCR